MSDFPLILDVTALSERQALEIRSSTLYATAGAFVDCLGDINGDGASDVFIAAAGGPYIVYGGNGAGSLELQALAPQQGFRISVEQSDGIGPLASAAGDTNGDGFDDFMIGAPGAFEDNYYTPKGGAYVVYGGPSPSGAIALGNLDPSEGFAIVGSGGGLVAGIGIAAAGDVDGDGLDDLLIEEREYIYEEWAHGALVFGSTARTGDVELGSLAPDEGFKIGPFVPFQSQSLDALGDVNGDGLVDFVFGDIEPWTSEAAGPGRAHVVFGKAPGSGNPTLSEGFTIAGEAAGDQFGSMVSGVGDFNGDGLDDILAGAIHHGVGKDRAYLIFGTAAKDPIETAALTPEQGFAIDDPEADGFLRSIGAAGDVNGDGFADLLLRYYYQSYVLFGKADGFGTVNLADLKADQGFIISGAGADARVSSAGDFNGDGIDDLIVGNPDEDLGARDSGAAWIIYGRAPAAAAVRIGSAGGQVIFGGAFNDTLGGLGGEDLLIGGKGDDRLDGGAGRDAAGYRTSAGGVRVDLALAGAQDTAAAGRDTLVSIENIEGSEHVDLLLGSAASNRLEGQHGDDRLFGRGGRDVLIGGDGADRLLGGLADDRMEGGRGDDWYEVRESLDLIREAGAGGTDTVQAFVTYALAANVEKLVLGGSAGIRGTGNALDNGLVGNSGANLLNGRGGDDRIDGGTGADTMIGGTGEDAFRVDQRGDRIVEFVGEGTDLVLSSVSYTLSQHVEELRLTGTRALSGTGNAQANRIFGNDAANALQGAGGSDSLSGGLGNDRLSGGAARDALRGGGGDDRFVFDSSLNAGRNVDSILDFVRGDDRIFLDQAVFSGIASEGFLSRAAFREGSVARDASDRILYDAATGKIFYDEDGTGSATAILFAEVRPGLTLTNLDFSAYGGG